MKVKEQIVGNWEDDNMAMYPPAKSTFETVSEGTHVAVCNMIADMGEQDGPYGIKHQVYLRFEVPGERYKYTDDEGKEHEGPRNIGKTYTYSLNEKATLRRDLESWRGKAFSDSELMDAAGNPIYDISKVVTLPCQISVVKSESGSAKIASVIGLPKGFPVPPIEGEAIVYDGDNQHNFGKLPEWLQKAINKQPVDDSKGHADQDIPFNDDVPF
jgi:hypothetical protein